MSTTDSIHEATIDLYERQEAELTYCHKLANTLRMEIAVVQHEAADPELPRNFLRTRTPAVLMNPILNTCLQVEDHEHQNKLRVLNMDLNKVTTHIIEFESFLGRLREELVELYGEF